MCKKLKTDFKEVKENQVCQSLQSKINVRLSFESHTSN